MGSLPMLCGVADCMDVNLDARQQVSANSANEQAPKPRKSPHIPLMCPASLAPSLDHTRYWHYQQGWDPAASDGGENTRSAQGVGGKRVSSSCDASQAAQALMEWYATKATATIPRSYTTAWDVEKSSELLDKVIDDGALASPGLFLNPDATIPSHMTVRIDPIDGAPVRER